MKTQFSSILILLLTMAPVWAVVGPIGFVDTKGPDSVCRILSRGDEGLSICSGTLIFSDKVLTAAHCIRTDHATMYIECGYQGVNIQKLKSELSISGNTVITEGVEFKESAIGLSSEINKQTDQSIVTLDKKLNSHPMKISAKTTGNLHECSAAGFGVNEEQTAGTLRVGKILEVILEENELKFAASMTSMFYTISGKVQENAEFLELIRNNRKEKMTSSIVLPGDSGGPILCKQKNGEFVVSGVISSVSALMISFKEPFTENIPTKWNLNIFSHFPDRNLIFNEKSKINVVIPDAPPFDIP